MQYAIVGSHKDMFLQASNGGFGDPQRVCPGLRDQFSDPGKCRDLITESSEMNTHSDSGLFTGLVPDQWPVLHGFQFYEAAIEHAV